MNQRDSNPLPLERGSHAPRMTCVKAVSVCSSPRLWKRFEWLGVKFRTRGARDPNTGHGGGAAKTTLVHHLGWWWQTTGLVDAVFYFGDDEQAHTRDQIVDHIGRRLYNQVVPPGMAVSPAFAQFQALLPAVRQTMLATRLHAERHLLILDNLESVTGESSAIPHTLSAEERGLVRSLLADLLDGQTLVLLGSRGREAWLTEGANVPLRVTDVYELPGLDDEAASTLAERILARHGATQHRTDEAFLELLKLLDGFPLALEVALANLARQTPAEVLAALRAGDVELDRGTGQSRTESLLRCIDYSHRQLAPEAQGLLACLAPFTGVLNTQLLPQYTEHLRQQPALAQLPWERLPAVVQEATDWGLLSPHPDAPEAFLRLQPVLPYFLRSRGQTAEHAEVTRAVAVAFRTYYVVMSGTLNAWLSSKDAPERQLGQVLVRLEYENLMTALRLALEDQGSILIPYKVLSDYLDTVKDERRGLALGEMVVHRLQACPEEARSGPLGAELLGVLDNIARRQLGLRQYPAAEASYQEALRLLNAQTALSRDTQAIGRAGMLHQLGIVAQEQRQWAAAEQYLQQALALKIEFNARYEQASTYHNLGIVAQAQQQWATAEQHYRQALAIRIEFNARYEQGRTYYQLGRVAEEQQQWATAEQHYRQALAIYGELNARYEQARPYHNLGLVARAQRQWAQAREFWLKALAITVEFDDAPGLAITMNSLARLWQATHDPEVPAAVGAILSVTPEEVEAHLSTLHAEEDEP
jgi:tetratricopeptide (TPR) repeat protein